MSLRDAGAALALADAVLEAVPDGDAEVAVTDAGLALTRFAVNTIHQSVAEAGTTCRLRLCRDGRVGVAEMRGDPQQLVGRLVESAEEARRMSPPHERVVPLPAPDGGADSPVAFSGRTARSTPEERAEMVALIVDRAAARGFEAFGALSVDVTRRTVVNSHGLRRTACTTAASLTSVVRGPDGAGFADRHGADVGSLDVETAAAEAVDTCGRNQGGTAVEPGEYEVVLSPYAVAEMLEYLSWMGFGALALQEHRSFMKLGEQVAGAGISICDDACDEEVLPFPFDAEGVSTRPVPLIERGVCAGVVYDTPTALVDGTASTGHGLPMPNTVGPMASHLRMEAGDTPCADLVSDVRSGLYVTRFWYVREVHPLRTLITGMTREGTFRIERGRIGEAVRDLRFTQSIVGALAAVRGISRERRLEILDGGGAALVPWLRVGSFAFTS